MHAAIPRLGQGTIFSEHEIFQLKLVVTSFFTLSILFSFKNVKIMKKLSVLINYKIYNLFNFLVSNTINRQYKVEFDIKYDVLRCVKLLKILIKPFQDIYFIHA